jgi:hypothetical protein
MKKSESKNQPIIQKQKNIKQFFQIIHMKPKNQNNISNIQPCENKSINLEKEMELNEENLCCPICLETFRNPITLSCK